MYFSAVDSLETIVRSYGRNIPSKILEEEQNFAEFSVLEHEKYIKFVFAVHVSSP